MSFLWVFVCLILLSGNTKVIKLNVILRQISLPPTIYTIMAHIIITTTENNHQESTIKENKALSFPFI